MLYVWPWLHIAYPSRKLLPLLLCSSIAADLGTIHYPVGPRLKTTLSPLSPVRPTPAASALFLSPFCVIPTLYPNPSGRDVILDVTSRPYTRRPLRDGGRGGGVRLRPPCVPPASPRAGNVNQGCRTPSGSINLEQTTICRSRHF